MSEQLKALVAKYQEYLNLNYVTSRSDPEEEPFLSKYVARALLKKEVDQLEQTVNSELPNDSGLENTQFQQALEFKHLVDTYNHFLQKLDAKCKHLYNKSAKLFLIIKLFEFNLAKNYVETEENETGQRLFAKIVQQLDVLDDSQTYNPILFNLKMSCFLELVFVWSNRSDYTRCYSLLTSLEEMYRIYRDMSGKSHLTEDESLVTMPFDPSELIVLSVDLDNEARKTSMESLYTYSLFYLAQIYGKLDNKEKSAEYCQLTLQRQIDEHAGDLGRATEALGGEGSGVKQFKQQPLDKIKFDPLDWATHAAALSQYYVCEEDFATARHCLICADAILSKLNKDKPADNAETNPNEKLNEQTHSIRRCWGKYGIELLRFAKRKMQQASDEPDTQLIHEQLNRPSKFHFNLPPILYDTKAAELQAITANIPLDFEQAREVFLKAQSILNEVKAFFVLDGFVTDHSEIIRDLSELYNVLIFFDGDLDRRCKMQKRRLDLLIPICDEISEQYYLALKRQYLFDIGSIYSELLDLKLEILSEKQEQQAKEPNLSSSNAPAIAKINQLANFAIKRFDAFLTTMKVQPERLVLPEKFDDHNVRPALLAKFYLGRLYSKIICTDPVKRLEYCRSTLENYTYLVNYCDQHRLDQSAEVIDSMQVEYAVCKEMCVFLPSKMDKLRALANK